MLASQLLACPRNGHLEAIYYRIFAYLDNKHNFRSIVFDPAYAKIEISLFKSASEGGSMVMSARKKEWHK